MKKIDFLNEIQPYLPLLKGNGRLISKRLGIDYTRYNYLVRGQAKESTEYKQIIEEAKIFNKEVQEEIKLTESKPNTLAA